MPAGTLIAQGGGGGATTTITVTAAPAAGEIVHLFWVGEGDSAPVPPRGRPDPSIANAFPNTITDSIGGTWAPFTGPPDNLAELGYSSSLGNDGGTWSSAPAPLGTWTGGTWRKIQLGSAIRTAGTTLGIGDTITVHWDAGGGFPDNSSLIAQGFTGVTNKGVPQYQGGVGPPFDVGVFYGNGDGWPDTTIGSNPNNPTISWFADLPMSFWPAPESVCDFVAAFAAYNVGAFAPITGSVLATHTQGSLTLVVTFKTALSNTALIDPGGTFTAASPPVTSGNYQFMVLTNPPPPQKCKTCGGMLGGMAVKASDPGAWL